MTIKNKSYNYKIIKIIKKKEISDLLLTPYSLLITYYSIYNASKADPSSTKLGKLRLIFSASSPAA